MSESSEELQVRETNPAADDEETQRENWKRKIIENLSKVDQTKYKIFYAESEILVEGEFCIYKVPDKLRQVKVDAYRPRVVSVGPLHRDSVDNLATMKQYKWFYMMSFFQQKVAQDPEDPKYRKCAEQQSQKCFEDCTEAIYGLDRVVRQCYTETIKYTEDELAEIMLLDGCFILELFLRFDRSLNYINSDQYKSDPCTESAWMIAALRHDLALLENQIPFFILELLYEAIKPYVIKCKLPKSVTSLALKFFQPLSLKQIKEETGSLEFKHLLDLLHKFYFLSTDEVSIDIDKESSSEGECSGLDPDHDQPVEPASDTKWGLNCASQLLKSGVKLKVGASTEDNLLKITFEDGVITIPQVLIHDTTSSLFRNLIAYEQCRFGGTHGVTSYAFLMKSLIRSPEDIKLLRRKKIIKDNRIGDKQDLTQFKNILDEVVVVSMDDFYFGKLCAQVKLYTSTYWFRRYIKDLYRTYFSSAWSATVFIASILAFILTSFQTYFTVYPR
ncbi:UPF0481 protein At3g47200-like [Prunus avium]|uniref:UPF0481 protein At3g47200-like n=1 Tax=Prunus avium TaxID=42229 RepID=A0A6P5RAQ6_PRUAV|nr:UPF0481 protein At3g47200-like [Prunus avium]